MRKVVDQCLAAENSKHLNVNMRKGSTTILNVLTGVPHYAFRFGFGTKSLRFNLNLRLSRFMSFDLDYAFAFAFGCH